MIGSNTHLSAKYDNIVQTSEIGSLLAVWLAEDLELMRREREQMDLRITRLEQRLDILRTRVATPATSGNATADAIETFAPTPARSAPVEPPHVMATPMRSIMSLKLETRTYNALTNGGISSFAQLMTMTREDLRALPGFGAGCLQDLEAALDRVQLALPVRAESRDDTETSPDDENVQESSYDTAIELRYRFGIFSADELRQTLSVDETEIQTLIREDSRWTALENGWFIRTDISGSWIARRIVEILSALKSVTIEPLFQSLKRIAASKFLEQGCRMPPRSLLIKIVQQLRSEGVQFDIVHEIARLDTPLAESELSRTNQAIMKAFANRHRALTSGEVVEAFEAAGMSEASANLALSSSPLITRLERGIYGLLGRNADLRDIASARQRRESGKAVDSIA